jgi:chitin-binding protein
MTDPVSKLSITTLSASSSGVVVRVRDATSIVVTTLPDTTGPTKPKNFHKVRRSGAYVKFNWAPSTDDVGVVRYYVYRTGRAKPVASTKVSKIRIRTVRGARYYVRAVDAAGNLSEKSAKVRGRR